MNTTRCSDNDLGSVLEGLHVITNAGTANAGVALNAHEVTNGNNDLLNLLGKLTGGREDESLAGLEGWVDLLEDGDGEGGGLSGSGLRLCDHIVSCAWSVYVWWGRWNVGKLTLNDGHNGTLLDGRRALETVGVDSTEELGLEVHRVEGVDRLIVVGFDLA